MNAVALAPPVLYTEDDENDAFLVRHCWRRAALAHPLTIFSDGQQPIDYLAGHGEFADRAAHPWPALLLLDLNLPRKSGHEVLAWVRAQPQFAPLPIAILSSSNQKKDLDRARALGATDYFVKPSNVTQLAALIAQIDRRWLQAMR